MGSAANQLVRCMYVKCHKDHVVLGLERPARYRSGTFQHRGVTWPFTALDGNQIEVPILPGVDTYFFTETIVLTSESTPESSPDGIVTTVITRVILAKDHCILSIDQPVSCVPGTFHLGRRYSYEPHSSMLTTQMIKVPCDGPTWFNGRTITLTPDRAMGS